MKSNYKNAKHSSLSLILISLILWNQFLIVWVNAETDFNIALELGTQIYEVKRYNDIEWKNCIGENIRPNNWFGNNTDKIGAKSKITTINWYFNNVSTYNAFILMIIPREKLQLFYNLSYYGYDRDYITENYTTFYKLGGYSYIYWPFTLADFEETMKREIEDRYFVQYPQNFMTLVDDYNKFSTIINNDPVLQTLNWSLPLFTGDDFLWQFILTGMVICFPFKNYLTTMLDAMECKNASVHDSTLILQRYGLNNYSVEIGYSTQGTIESIVIKNSNNRVIYEITSYNPKMIFFIIFGIVASFIGVGVILLIIRRRSKMRLFLESFNDTNR